MWIILIPYYVLRRERRFLERFPPEAKKEQRILEGKYEMMIVAAVSFLFVGARYIVYPYPQGWDTAYYIYYLRKLTYDVTFFSQIMQEKFLVYVILYILNLFFIDPNFTTIIVPIGAEALFSIGVFALIWEVSGDQELGFYAGIITAVTFSASRLFLDLYANFMAWTAAMYLFVFVARILKRHEPNLRNTFVIGVLSLVIMFIHPWTLYIVMGITGIFVFLVLLFARKHAIRIVLSIFIAFLPAIVLIALAYKPYEILAKELIQYAVRKPFLLAEREDPLIIFTGILGVLYLIFAKKKTVLHGIVLAWYITVSILLATGAYYQSFRFLNLMPIGILSAFGLKYLTTEFPQKLSDTGQLSIIKKFYKNRAKVVVSLVLLLILLTALPNSYIPDHVMRPSQDAMEQLKWIRDHYGFENRSIIVLVNKKVPMASGSWIGNYLDWAVSEVGQVIYPGSLIEFVQGIVFSLLPHPSILFQVPTYTPDTILIPDKWYVITDFEEKYIRKISDTGIYSVDTGLIVDLETAILTMSKEVLYIRDYSISGDVNAFNIVLTNSTTGFVIEYMPEREKLSVTIDLSLGNISGSYLVLKVYGIYTDVVNVLISALINNNIVWTKCLNDYLFSEKNYAFIPFLVEGQEGSLTVRFSFQSYASIEVPLRIKIGYFVII